MADAPAPLEYQTPRLIARRHSRRLALALCAPGAATFVLFFVGVVFDASLPYWLGSLVGHLFMPLWLLALGTALSSVCLYVRFPFRPLPWFVTLNLFLNISGLLFSLLCLGSVLLH